jgi:glycosyltransferase involved in cell wall biosynthesis
MQHSYIEYSDAAKLAKDPLVSVVMLTYNHERYLAEAIEGVVRQATSFPIELLIGEDCSTDGTRAIALEYQRWFPEVIRVIVSERNVGMHPNLRRTIMAARGKYVAFCEGDDFWHRPDKLERQIAVLEGSPDVSIVCSNYQIISDNGALIESDVLRCANRSGYFVSFEDVLLAQSPAVVKTLTVCAKLELVKKALIESPLCRKKTYLMGDIPLWVELARHGKCYCVPEVLCSYRHSNNSATRGPDPLHSVRLSASGCELFNDALDLYGLPQGDAATLDAKVRVTRFRLRSVGILGDPSTARKQLQRLRELGVVPTLKDRLLGLLAYLVRPGTLGATAMPLCAWTWRTIRFVQHWTLRSSS